MSPGSRPIQGTRPTSMSTTPARTMSRPKPMRILPMFIVAGSMRPACIEGGLRQARPGSARRCSLLIGRRARLGDHRPSAYSLEKPLLAGGGGWRLLAEVTIGLARDAAAVRGADDEADLQQIRLDELGQGLGFVVDRRGDGLEP